MELLKLMMNNFIGLKNIDRLVFVEYIDEY